LNFLHEKSDSKTFNNQLAAVRRNVKRADYIVAISKFVMDDIIRNADLIGFDTNKSITFIHNGYELNSISLDFKPTYVPTRPFLFSVGSIIEKKNYHVLPPVLEGNELELIIAGGVTDNNYIQRILTEAQSFGVESRVTVLSNISEEDKTWYYSNCKAYLQPSLAEGFGLPVIEAMSLGKPVFLSRRTSLPEIGGNLAVYFDAFDANTVKNAFNYGMQHFESENNTTDIISHAQQFSWKKAAKLYLDVYDELLK
jgi:glycosyltransferase involved in cell wall biosynthesis